MVNYQIADLVTRINNTFIARNSYLEVPYTKDNYDILNVLNKLGIVEIVFNPPQNKGNHYKLEKNQNGVMIGVIITLMVCSNSEILEPKKFLHIISKPSKRCYISYKKLKDFNHGYKSYILRTSKGIISSQTAIKEQIGGELLLKITYAS